MTADEFLNSALTSEVRMNADYVQTSFTDSYSGLNPIIDNEDPIDQNETGEDNFFNTDHSAGLGSMDGLSTKEYTSLKHFKVRSNRHNPIKRDAVEMCFEKDLEIFRITKNFKRTLKWMILKGMLPECRKCPACDMSMRIVNCHTKVKDGLMFKCSRLECRDIKVSIREGTIFDGNHMTMMEILRCIFYFFTRGFNAL